MTNPKSWVGILSISIIIFSSCSSEEDQPTPPSGPKIQRTSNLPSQYAGKSINKIGCEQVEQKSYEIKVWNPYTSQKFNGDVIVNGYSKFNGEIPQSRDKAIVIIDSFDNLGFNYLLFIADSFPQSYARVKMELLSGSNSFQFPMLSDIDNSEGANIVVKHESIQCGANSSMDTTFGEVVFWLAEDQNCGNIYVELVGNNKRYAGFITRYFQFPDIAVCGSRGCANFVLNVGNYEYSAFCDDKNWGPVTVTVSEDFCRRVNLK